MSDIHSAAWFAAAFWFALRGARHGAHWFAVAGMVFALSVLIRPTNIVMVPAILLLAGPSPRRIGAFVIAGAPFAFLLGFYQQSLFGSPLASGYGPLATAFSADFVSGALRNYASWIWVLATPVALLAPMAPWCTRGEPRIGVALTVWWVSSFGFYLFYFHTSEAWWYLRFILPAFPALIAGGTLGLSAIVDRFTAHWPSPVRHSIIPAALVGLALHAVFWTDRLHVLHVKPNESAYFHTCEVAGETIPEDAIVACMQFSGSLTYYTGHKIVRYDWLQEANLQVLVSAIDESGRPLFAVLQPWEFPDIRAAIPGDWEVVATSGTNEIWKWHPSRSEP